MRALILASQLAKQMGVQVDPNFRWKMAAVNGGEAVRQAICAKATCLMWSR